MMLDTERLSINRGLKGFPEGEGQNGSALETNVHHAGPHVATALICTVSDPTMTSCPAAHNTHTHSWPPGCSIAPPYVFGNGRDSTEPTTPCSMSVTHHPTTELADLAGKTIHNIVCGNHQTAQNIQHHTAMKLSLNTTILCQL